MPSKKALPNSSPQTRPGNIATSRAVGRGALGNTQDINIASVTPGVSLDVNLQDQTTPAIIIPFHKTFLSTTLTAATVRNEYTCTVASAAGVTTDHMVLLYNTTIEAFSWYKVVSVDGTTITVDSLIDVEFPTAGTSVDFASYNIAVDGSTTPQIFGLRGSTNNPPVGASFDMTRIMFAAKAIAAVDLAKFVDQPRLTRGLLLRHRNDGVHNVLNFKNNGELAAMCFDHDVYSATNPQQGQDGFVARLTFAGQNKIGVVLRVHPGEDIEIIVQDDLTGIEKYVIMAEGHVVD